MFLFLQIIINRQHYIIIKSHYKSWLLKAQSWISLESSSKSFGSIVKILCLILDAQSMQGLSTCINSHLTFCTKTKPFFYSNCHLHCTVIYLITPHLQQLEPCAEMLSVTTVPQAPGAFFCSLPKTGKKKISTGFVLHTMYCTPHHSHSVLFIKLI